MVDINLYYRLMKMQYGSSYQRWNVRGAMRSSPLLFGVWHAYKDTLLGVFRAFHAVCVYAAKGTVAVGSHHPVHPSLRSVERLFAALLMLDVGLKGRVRQAAERALVDERAAAAELRAAKDACRRRSGG